jgi:hypothetical protein
MPRRGGIPDPAAGDRVHAGRPHDAEHAPVPLLVSITLAGAVKSDPRSRIIDFIRPGCSPRHPMRLVIKLRGLGVAAGRGEGGGFVVRLAGGQAAVEVAEEPVVEVASAVVVGAGAG